MPHTGTTQEFNLTAKDLSYLSYVNIRMVPTDSDPQWHLDKVEVRTAAACLLTCLLACLLVVPHAAAHAPCDLIQPRVWRNRAWRLPCVVL